jgi:uncharacterized protein (DUF488 family)
MTIIYTIGHSNHDWPTFQALLKCVDIETILDVRSNPASRHSHFNGGPLKARLEANEVAYEFLGRELGGRPRQGEATDYEAMALAAPFLDGVAQVERRAVRARTALLCSEHEPLVCHRCLLVGRRLAEAGYRVAHILRDGTIEPNEATEQRLLALARQSVDDSFAPLQDRIARAYRVQAHRFQYVAVK